MIGIKQKFSIPIKTSKQSIGVLRPKIIFPFSSTAPRDPEKKDEGPEIQLLKALDSGSQRGNFTAKEIISIIGLLKIYDVSKSPHLSSIIKKCFAVDNIDLHKALEENLKIKLRTTEILKENKEKAELEVFEAQRKKIVRRTSFFFKLFLASFVLTTAFRGYFYLEYEVDPLHPRVSDYLLYRFR